LVFAVLAAFGLAAPAGAAAAAATLTVKSVPQLQGVDFVFAGHRYTTGKGGTVRIRVPAPGTYRLRALPWRHVDRGVKVAFSRWGDNSFSAARPVRIHDSKTLEVGYGVSYRRGFRFYDCVGAEASDMNQNAGCEDRTRTVSPERVSSVTLVSSTGDKVVLRPQRRPWLEGARVTPRPRGGLEETLIYYSVMQVRVAGSDVVNQAQQRFYLTAPPKHQRIGHMRPATNNLLIRLSLYDAHFTAHDLLLRTPAGNALELTYPDGRKTVKPFNDGELTLRSLPRGLYHVKVITKAGIKMTVPISLSKNQDMQLTVISFADLGGTFLIFVLISLLLISARRPGMRAAIRSRLSQLGGTVRTGHE
jgi:hypothetical protein